MRNVSHLDVSFIFANMIVTQDQLIDILWSILGVAKELFLTNVCKTSDEIRARLWSHDTITKATHGFIAEDISEGVFFSSRAPLSRWHVEYVILFCVHGACDHV